MPGEWQAPFCPLEYGRPATLVKDLGTLLSRPSTISCITTTTTIATTAAAICSSSSSSSSYIVACTEAGLTPWAAIRFRPHTCRLGRDPDRGWSVAPAPALVKVPALE
ncbi:hypothetical protein Cob_v012835 [Colletotrichum orbiculare MAFF 240422]|uniref:Uncharacterized protein n=1 Tax=Colletotrichum orbiculare (strain 104-T / ATCC 96160 / CBS 514.97 / LARS 414 / MAFF 240422) TaxID=1213857 RepID=A0A484FA17_COLOR|nr:hypothetical protein Cob_v012835 [Colletotrichum orbiculare MAFF 240422]